MVPTNTGIFLRGLKLYGESRTKQVLLVSQKKIGGNHAYFSEIIKLQFRKKYHIILYFVFFIFILALFRNIVP